MSGRLQNIIKDKHSVFKDEGRVSALMAVRIKALRSVKEYATEYNKAYFEDIVSGLLNNHENTSHFPQIGFGLLSKIVGDHSVVASNKTEWDGLLERYAATLMEDQKGCVAVAASLPRRMIKGNVRETFILCANDKKLVPMDRSIVLQALGRGDKEYTVAEHILADARLALVLLGDIPSRGVMEPDFSKVTSKKDMLAKMKLTDTDEVRAKTIIFMALEDITGRKDCGYDIEKWRAAVAELEAKAGNGGTKAAGE